ARGSLQSRLRQKITEAIAGGHLREGEPLPSTRTLAEQLGISRNTVTLTYQELVDDGYLTTCERRGYFVAADLVLPSARSNGVSRDGSLDWKRRLSLSPSLHKNTAVPLNWREKKYTFNYGQHDRSIFPIASWRKCSREALARNEVHDWTVDYVDADDPLLIDQFRRRVLPRRGFAAEPEQILLTVGAQHALFLIAQILVKPGTVVAMENPTYVDARNIFRLFGAEIRPIPVDHDGLIIDGRLAGCDLVYVTPSHQSPTTVTMSVERRQALLRAARAHDFLIIEDDYDTETRFGIRPNPTLKSHDTEGRVIYFTSLSKLLSPGLRVGFIVGHRDLVREIRVLRRLSIRHPPANNQRTIALFLRGGHYETLLRRFHQEYEARWRLMGAAIAEHLPGCSVAPSQGGSSYWVRGPDQLDADELALRAFAQDIVIEPGTIYFTGSDAPRTFFRLGFSSIAAELIEPGIAALARVMRETIGTC
ncbi:MAG: PLP-dependent aminotransferase family protein, partial [Alphaproteobacteria bacterium]|nr:PLP-dependent aminotransferase family protein [Alphaproteobacteria bacterium]